MISDYASAELAYLTPHYGVPTPTLLSESAQTAKHLALARINNLTTIADVEHPTFAVEPPTGNAGAHFRAAYWLATAAQLAGGRGKPWNDLYTAATKAFAEGNMVGAGVQLTDQRIAILERAKLLAYDQGIGESASALSQLAAGVQKQKSKLDILWIVGGVVVGGLTLLYLLRR